MRKLKSGDLPRYAVFAAVVALHAVLVWILLVSRSTLGESDSTQSIVTTLLVRPTKPIPDASPDATRERLSKKNTPAALPPLLITAPSPTISPPQNSAPPDWAAESQRAAATLINKDGESDGAANSQKEPSLTPRSWFPAASHRHGDQYKTSAGQQIVWINDSCYVSSDATTSTISDVGTRSKLSVTVCPGKSRIARGDLFDQLPAYKQHQAE